MANLKQNFISSIIEEIELFSSPYAEKYESAFKSKEPFKDYI